MNITKCFGALAMAAILMSILAQAAEARRYYRQDYSEPHYSGRSVVVCQKLCPQDFSPCDPIYFKTADGRCSSIHTR